MNIRNSSLCEAVRAEIAAAVGAGSGMVTVGPGFGGTSNGMGHCIAKTAGDAVRTKYHSRPHPRLLCTDDEHELRYPLSSVRN